MSRGQSEVRGVILFEIICSSKEKALLCGGLHMGNAPGSALSQQAEISAKDSVTSLLLLYQ